ncbi:MAG: MT-A70 family methyltransferase [Candidatus Thorarchaeota archaeon]
MTVYTQQEIITETGEIVPTDGAWDRHQRIVGYRNLAEKTFLALGEELYYFERDKQYTVLGEDTFESYLARPDVDIGRRMAFLLKDIYITLTIGLKVQPVALLEAGHSKLSDLLPQIGKGNIDKTNVNEWIVKAGELSRSDLKREIADAFPKAQVPLPDGQYGIIYADPPWKYSDKLIDGYGAADHHYPQMTIEELCELAVKDMVGDDAVLFIWVTSPLLFESEKVIKAWGFEYKTSFVWDKVKHNYGHYNSVRHEFLLVCTRGSKTPDNKELYDSVQTVERSKKHSEKPEEFRKIIDDLYPHGGRIELFARKQTDGWDAWGNEAG